MQTFAIPGENMALAWERSSKTASNDQDAMSYRLIELLKPVK
jgi:hypothetical protein